MDDNICAETLIFNGIPSGTVIEVPERGLEYTTRIMAQEFDYYFPDLCYIYPMLPLYGKVYVPLASDRANKLAELLLDNDDRFTLYLNESLELGSGYALKLKQIDESGNKVVLEFLKDGYPVTSQALDLSVGDPFYATWNLYVDGIEGENDVLVFKVHVNQVFDAGENSFIEIEGLWLIDYANALP
jgi:S-layer protein (TIGR01567 family)